MKCHILVTGYQNLSILIRSAKQNKIESYEKQAQTLK
jgi:hypothetical protein